MLGYLRRRTGSVTVAEELAQETFYRATRAFLGWRGGSPAAWLLAIARNVLVDEARRGRRLVPLSETLPAPGSPSTTSLGVRETLARLPANQGRLLELIYVDGYTHAEVAAMTGTTAGAVKTAAWRARQAFQQLYQEEEGGIVRTALTGVFIVFSGWVILTLLTFYVQRLGDREERFQSVIGLGFLVAHPDWRGEPGGCCNTDLTSLELFLDVQPQTPEPLSPMTKAWLRLNILGRLVIDSIPILPETPIQHAISGGRPGKEETRALLDELPQPVRASAVVEPVTPLGVDEFGELLAVARMLGEGVSNTAPTDFSPRDRPRRVFVGVEREGAPVESFQPPGLR